MLNLKWAGSAFFLGIEGADAYVKNGKDADVEHHPGGAHPLAVQQPELVAQVVHEAELVHEPLGVEGPTLAVTRSPASSRRHLLSSSGVYTVWPTCR